MFALSGLAGVAPSPQERERPLVTRILTRTLVFAVVILAAFWFTTANANEVVTIDLVRLRIRASLPLVVFTSLLAGMGLSTLIAWRAERKTRRREETRASVAHKLSDPVTGLQEQPGKD